MAFIQPNVGDFKAYFVRDFPYGTTMDDVMDADILRAINEASINFNQAFFADQGSYSTAFLLFAAHYLTINLQASSQGIAGAFTWLQTSKAVGSVNESFQIPQRILDNPELAMISKTTYGSQYLLLILPQLAGNMFGVCGGTHP